jgi:hypothetical protein
VFDVSASKLVSTTVLSDPMLKQFDSLVFRPSSGSVSAAFVMTVANSLYLLSLDGTVSTIMTLWQDSTLSNGGVAVRLSF